MVGKVRVCLLLASSHRTPLTLLCVRVTLTAAHWHPNWGYLPWSFMAHCSLRAAGTKPLSMGQELLQTCCYQSRPSPPGRGCLSSTMGWAGASEETRGWCLCCIPKAGPHAAQPFAHWCSWAAAAGTNTNIWEAVVCRCNRALPSPLKPLVQACCSPGAARN